MRFHRSGRFGHVIPLNSDTNFEVDNGLRTYSNERHALAQKEYHKRIAPKPKPYPYPVSRAKNGVTLSYLKFLEL